MAGSYSDIQPTINYKNRHPGRESEARVGRDPEATIENILKFIRVRPTIYPCVLRKPDKRF